MAKHKPLCLVVMILVIVGGLNWGLVGLGMLIGNATLTGGLVHLIFSFSSVLEAIIYLVVGAAAVASLVFTMGAKECACEKMNKYLDRAALIGTIDNPSIGFFEFLKCN